MLVNEPVPGRQFLILAELLQDVVHVGDRQLGMQRLLPLAVGVEGFAEDADAGFLGLGGGGEGKPISVAVALDSNCRHAA